MPDLLRIVVADDYEIAREGMQRVIQSLGDMEVVGQARTLQQVVDLVREEQPDALLLDLKWFGNESAGTEVIPEILRSSPGTKVIAITAYEHLMDAARRAGAAAAITKEIERSRLRDIIRDVCASPTIPALPATPTSEVLTDREQEVLALLVRGLTDREISDELSIAESTAKNHVRSILGKLGVSNRTQAAFVARERGLLSN